MVEKVVVMNCHVQQKVKVVVINDAQEQWAVGALLKTMNR